MSVQPILMSKGNHTGMILCDDGRTKRILIVERKYRSKWWFVTCGCPLSRRRKDGSCAHQRALIEASSRGRYVRVDPEPMGARKAVAS